MTSRDPGFIARAFPSRAQRRMEQLKAFDADVRAHMYDPAKDPTYVANNPESEAAMRAVASRPQVVAAEGGATGKTSSPSPSRPSAADRRELTGVRENVKAQGWGPVATAMPHLCFPPNQYPQGCGPGSQWRCRCGALWVAQGIAWEDYPTDPTRTAQPLAPEQWFYVSNGQLAPEDYRSQEGLYDWRPLGPYYVRLYRAMIENQLGGGVTWQELG